MLPIEEILAAVNTKLKEAFHIDINSNDVTEGFDRPSFYVVFDNVAKTDYLRGFKRNLTVRIYYFPTNRYKYQLEILEKQQGIEALFRLGLQVNNRHLNIVEGIESYITDGVLQISFDLEFYDVPEDNDGAAGDKMMNLLIK